jgi:four helix bundle protein
VKDFRDLLVWHKAHQLTLMVYRLSASFLPDERYGVTRQLRRSSSSIAANLAESCGRNSDAELGRFCSIAMGSASELDYHLLLARDLKLLNEADDAQLAAQATEVKKMLAGLIQKLKADCCALSADRCSLTAVRSVLSADRCSLKAVRRALTAVR